MSILIKGMEMPCCCDECRFLDEYGDYPRCIITDEQRGYNFKTREKRMDNCPLVPVPPHGRLIDAGELYDKVDAILTQILGYRDGEDVRSQSFQSGAYYSIQKVKNALSNAPTIIPAEEVKES